MKKTTPNPNAPKAFNAGAAVPALDMQAAIDRNDVGSIKIAAMRGLSLNDFCPTVGGLMLPLVYAMQIDARDVFDWMVTSQRADLNKSGQYLHGPAQFTTLEAGTPLDAAFNLERQNAPNGKYYLNQLITNGARATIGKHAGQITRQLPELDVAASPLPDKGLLHISSQLGNPANN